MNSNYRYTTLFALKDTIKTLRLVWMSNELTVTLSLFKVLTSSAYIISPKPLIRWFLGQAKYNSIGYIDSTKSFFNVPGGRGGFKGMNPNEKIFLSILLFDKWCNWNHLRKIMRKGGKNYKESLNPGICGFTTEKSFYCVFPVYCRFKS